MCACRSLGDKLPSAHLSLPSSVAELKTEYTVIAEVWVPVRLYV